MKIKTISRSQSEAERESNQDIRKVHRNVDPKLHPLERAREYSRALRAVKMERMFAQPLVQALSGHLDGVYSTATSQKSLVAFVSGGCDGEVRVWDVPSRKTLWSAYGHDGFVEGLSIDRSGQTFYSVGQKIIKQWRLSTEAYMGSDSEDEEDVDGTGLLLHEANRRKGKRAGKSSIMQYLGEQKDYEPEPIRVWNSSTSLLDVDCSRIDDTFVTSSSHLEVWDVNRSQPSQRMSLASESLHCCRFNHADNNIVASAGSERTVCIYDLRAATPVRSVVLSMRSNALDWNPREPMNFTVANEDHNAYTFDMRKLKKALCVHKDHTSAVMDIRYSPTGREFATASYDCTVRLWGFQAKTSRDMYHTRRMQRVFTVNYSGDGQFVISGSDDTNLRLWKAIAWKSLTRATPRERASQDYMRSLVKRYSHMPEVKKISRSRNTPKFITSAKRRKVEQEESSRRKFDNRVVHSKDKNAVKVAEREKSIVKEVD